MDLHEASQSGDMERVAQLIDEGADINAASEDRERTPLHCAVENDKREVAKYLIGKVCLLEAKDEFGDTPLMTAANRGSWDLVEMLLASGADIKASDSEGWNLLHFAANSNNLEVVRIVLESGKIDINSKTKMGETALMCAVGRNHRDAVNRLLASGADILACDEDSLNVLHYAAGSNSLDVAQDILQIGELDLNMKDSDGNTAMMIAASDEHWGFVDLLLSSGADVNVRNNNNTTALYYMLKRKNVGLFLSVFNHGAYLESSSYQQIYKNKKTRKQILENAELCTVSILNKYNEDWLPSIYGKLRSAVELPQIESLKMYPFQNVAKEIKKCLAEEIGSKGFCRVLDARPPVLKWLCARSLVGCFSSSEKQAPEEAGPSNKRARLH